MPGSFPVFDAVVGHLLQRLAPARALDIGAGAGKYGRLLAAAAPQGWRMAVERNAGHVQQFDLRQLYHEVAVADVGPWWQCAPAEHFDVALLGDCLEWMPKSAGMDLLNALVYRCAWVVLVTCEHIAPARVDGIAQAPRLSVWSERDLHWHDLWAWEHCRATTLVVLRGLQPSPTLGLAQWVLEANAARLPVHHFDGQSVVRPAHLRLVQHPRDVDYRLP